MEGATREAIRQAVDVRARARVAIGREARGRTCAGCGRGIDRDDDSSTPGCQSCARRLRSRRRYSSIAG
jgi:hypothetical protein